MEHKECDVVRQSRRVLGPSLLKNGELVGRLADSMNRLVVISSSQMMVYLCLMVVVNRLAGWWNETTIVCDPSLSWTRSGETITLSFRCQLRPMS